MQQAMNSHPTYQAPHISKPSIGWQPTASILSPRPRSVLPSWMQHNAPMLKAVASGTPVMEQPVSPPSPTNNGNDLGWATSLEHHFSLQHFIGAGSYGVIHAARDAHGREVAIKCIAKDRPNAPRTRTLRRLAREAALMERLAGCPNVVQLLGKYEDAMAVYFVMELASGQDLAAWLQEKGQLSEAVVSRITYECLHILRACHAQSIVHADLKPNNLLVEGDILETDCAHGWHGLCSKEKPLVKLLDFGCSQAFTPGVPLSRRTGTPIYMAPEVYRKSYGPPADVWSLGVMMFQLLTGGQFPFWSNLRDCLDSSIEDVMYSILDSPLHLRHLDDAGLSRECRALLLSMLDRDPSTRITVEQALQHPWFDAMDNMRPHCDCEHQEKGSGEFRHTYNAGVETSESEGRQSGAPADVQLLQKGAEVGNIVPLDAMRMVVTKVSTKVAKSASRADSMKCGSVMCDAVEASEAPSPGRGSSVWGVWAMMQHAIHTPVTPVN